MTSAIARPKPVASVAPAPATAPEVTPSTDLGHQPLAPASSSTTTDPFAS
jgi:hypothetical protein